MRATGPRCKSETVPDTFPGFHRRQVWINRRSLHLVAAAVLFVVLGGAGCSSGGSNAAQKDGQVAVEDQLADNAQEADTAQAGQKSDAKRDDATAADSKQDGGATKEESPDKLPKTAVGTALVTSEGAVYAVNSGPPHWAQVYSAADQNGARALAASASGKMVVFLLDSGSVYAQPNGVESGEPLLVWGGDGDKSPASSIDAHENRIDVVTSDGNVHSLDIDGDSVTETVVWTADQGVAEQVATVKAGVFVLHAGQVDFVARGGEDPQELPVEQIVDIDARSTRLVALDSNGAVTTVDAAEPGATAKVLWDGSGAPSKVTDVALGSNLVMLFEDGTVLRKSPNDDDPVGGAITVWDQIEKKGPAAVGIGARNKFVMFQLDNDQARWLDLSAPKGERSGVYFRPKDGQVASLAS